MSSTYKLTYFDVRGYAEPARFLFLLADVPFDDQRLAFDDGAWERIKEKTPFGQVPVLTIDGSFQIPQSVAIIRFLARKFGFAGATPQEEAFVDAVVDQFRDFNTDFRQMVMAKRFNKPSEEIDKIIREVSIPARDVYFKILNGLLEKSTSGWLVGDALTWADLVVADHLTTLEKNDFFAPAEQPRLVALRERVYSLEKLKHWIATRPDTQF